MLNCLRQHALPQTLRRGARGGPVLKHFLDFLGFLSISLRSGERWPDGKRVWSRVTESMARWRESVAQRYRKHAPCTSVPHFLSIKPHFLHLCSTLPIWPYFLHLCSTLSIWPHLLYICSTPSFDQATLAAQLFHTFFRSRRTCCTSVLHFRHCGGCMFTAGSIHSPVAPRELGVEAWDCFPARLAIPC